MKNNSYKKEFQMDEFGRKFYCQHARINQVRNDKKQAKRKARKNLKNLSKNFENPLDKQ